MFLLLWVYRVCIDLGMVLLLVCLYIVIRFL